MTGSNGGLMEHNFPLGVAVPDATIADPIFENPKFQSGVCTILQWRSGPCTLSAPEPCGSRQLQRRSTESPDHAFDLPVADAQNPRNALPPSP
jgi:hypothetical protein